MTATAVTDRDRTVATTIYRQIGPVVAGNMDAKASRAGAIPGGLRMGGCLMGRSRRVDVDVVLTPADLYDVTVTTAMTLRKPGGDRVLAVAGVDASQIRGLMLAIGDNNTEALAGWSL